MSKSHKSILIVITGQVHVDLSRNLYPSKLNSLVPRPRPAFRRLQYGIFCSCAGRAWEWG